MTPSPILRFARFAAFAAMACVVTQASAAPAPVSVEPGTPARAYLDLRSAVDRATTPESVFPLLDANYRRVLSNLPRAERDAWLVRTKRHPPSPVKVQAQALAADRCTLGAVARDATHVKWSGRIEMVREGGSWRLADEVWTAEPR
jgi:hypothetical protein